MKSDDDAKLRKLGVAIVYLFGSKAAGTSTPTSDTDIGVVLKEPAAAENAIVLYNALYDLFAERYPNSTIDLVFLQSAPLPLQYYAVRDGMILFEADAAIASDYAAYVINGYLDFKPLLEYIDKISTERYTRV